MLKIKKIIISIILLSFYVNTSVIAILLLFDFLPFILNTIVLYFILPMAFAYITGSIGGRLLNKSIPFSENIFFKTTMILGLVMWLAIMPASFMDLKHFIQLKTYKTPLVTNIENLTQKGVKDAAFITITDAALLTDKKGVYKEISKVKSGENYTTTYYDYYAVPVSGSDFKVWICDYSSYTKNASEDDKSPPYFIVNQHGSLAGIVVQDKNRLKDYKIAIEKSLDYRALNVEDSLIILEYRDDFESTMSSYKTRAIWYFVLLNLLLVILPVVLIRKMI